MKAADIITAARVHLGTPAVTRAACLAWHWTVPACSLPCAKTLGLQVEDEAGYGRTPFKGLLEQCIDRQPFLTRVPREQMQAGDVLLMRFQTDPQHVAFHAGDTMIHAYSNVGRVVEHRIADVWRARVVHVYRFEAWHE